MTREVGLTAVQLWQSLAEAQGRGRGEVDVAILFTDLVDFSTWALEAGDEAAIQLLGDVGERSEEAVDDNGGEVVKRLGDGMMAVFGDADGRREGRPRRHGAVVGDRVRGLRPRAARRAAPGPPAQGAPATTWAWT